MVNLVGDTTAETVRGLFSVNPSLNIHSLSPGSIPSVTKDAFASSNTLMIPLVESYDLNLIWFGVVVIKLLEIGLITPPVGLNVFVIANVVGKDAPIDKIFAGVARFLSVDVIVLILIMSFPALSLLIPMAAR